MQLSWNHLAMGADDEMDFRCKRVQQTWAKTKLGIIPDRQMHPKFGRAIRINHSAGGPAQGKLCGRMAREVPLGRALVV